MTDAFHTIAVDVHCEQCGEFAIGADVIAESQHLLADGCFGSPYECPAALFATFLSESTVASLERAFSGLEIATQRPVRRIAIDWPRVGAHTDDELDPLAISRWEDDGGCPTITPQPIRMADQESCRTIPARTTFNNGATTAGHAGRPDLAAA